LLDVGSGPAEWGLEVEDGRAGGREGEEREVKCDPPLRGDQHLLVGEGLDVLMLMLLMVVVVSRVNRAVHSALRWW
jgi:hypothetical protein